MKKIAQKKKKKKKKERKENELKSRIYALNVIIRVFL